MRLTLLGLALSFILLGRLGLRVEERGGPSSGCGRLAPAQSPTAIRAQGHMREVITVVPDGYQADVPHRLVFAFHGRTTPNTRARSYFGLEANVKRPTIFVYPSGRREEDGKFSWYDKGDPADQLRDYALFDTLLAKLSADYCVDLDQVFVVGHSLGGSFANSLGCARGSVIRGVGSVAGRIWETKCNGPVAAMILHNPEDDQVPISRGLRARDWALAQNGLEPPAQPCEPRALDCECYGPPGTANPVVWCPHKESHNRHGENYPHLWPKGTGAAIMGFFDSLTPPAPPADANGGSVPSKPQR